MKFDKNKVVAGEVYPVKDEYLVFANGALRITTEGVTSFQDISPYNYEVDPVDIPYAYEGHGGVDFRATSGTPVYAEKDCTITFGRDSYGNKVICNGFRMRHMDNLPTKSSFKKGEVVFYTGSDMTSAAHLHIGMENGGDAFATFVEGKPTSTPPKEEAPKSVKGYSFNECSANNGSSFFDIETYGSTEDDLCFSIGNLKSLGDGVYNLTKAQHSYAVNTQFRKIKTTFYTDGTKSSGSSSSYTKVKVVRSGKTQDNGTFYFPLSAWEDIKDLTLAKDTKDCDGIMWEATTTFNSAVRV